MKPTYEELESTLKELRRPTSQRSHTMSKSYIVIQQYLWCNESGHGIEYASDCVEFGKRDQAIKHGLKQQGSDDFNIGVIENGRLVSFDWMDKPVGESGENPESLAKIAESIGYEGAAQ